MNTNKLAREYLNIQKQLQRGKQIGFEMSLEGKLVPKYREWSQHEYAVREAKMEWCMRMLRQVKTVYETEVEKTKREPAIATVDADGSNPGYAPLSKTGLTIYQIHKLKG
jgi:hypothetical protein